VQFLNKYKQIVMTAATILIAALVIGFGWKVQARDARLFAENKELKRSVGLWKPHIIRNFDLDLLPYLSPVSQEYTRATDSGDRFIFIARDACHFCAAQIPFWKRMVAAAPKNTEIWLVSLDAGEHFAELANFVQSSGHVFRRFGVRDSVAFVLSTGILGTPATIVTKDQVVTMYYPGLFTEDLFAKVQSLIYAPASAGATFFHSGQRDIISPVMERKAASR
jgi:hypothetical protein